jgi:tripeptidyl-peptidase-1
MMLRGACCKNKLTCSCRYMKLGLQGVSVLYSSGDFGASGNDNQCCVYPNCAGGDLQDGASGGFFNPQFAASCPWVTAVGATQINPGSTVSDPESATDFSGGGFSNAFSRPNYQSAAVSNYFTNYNPGYSASQFNSNGRGYPDISANGLNIAIIEYGSFTTVGGTSASCPIVASLFTLINNQLIDAGKPVIGFANYVLYQHPEAMNDIVTGSAPACNTNGFSAVPGWDPITGLGTPDYVSLLNVFMNLSNNNGSSTNGTTWRRRDMLRY